MLIEDFIEEFRSKIDSTILSAGVTTDGVDDDEREMWVINDEELYNLAASMGVDV